MRGLASSIGILWAAALLTTCDSAGTGPIPSQPNFVVIMTDDLDWAAMPYLPRLQDRLADRGASFGNFFTPNSVCSPSRASFLRGQYSHNHGVPTNFYPTGGFRVFRDFNRESSTLATWLQAAGYRTVHLGKYMNEYPVAGEETYVPDGWTEWYTTLEPAHYFNFRANENGTVVEYPCCDVYEIDLQTSQAADFIRRAARSGDPFFVYMATYAPHLSSKPAPRHAAAFSSAQAPRSPSFNEADVSDKPSVIASLDELTPQQIEELDEIFRNRLRTMLAVEDMLDTLLAVLESEDMLDETYIFFTSDNGFHFAEHRLGRGKTTAYDEDIRVPLFIRGPGIAGGAVDEIALSIDVAPTIADLAGIPTPAFVDGRSLVALIRGWGSMRGGWRRGFISQHWRPQPNLEGPNLRYTQLGYRALRTNEHLYVEWDTGEFELYDRSQDPFELENIYSAADPALIAELSSWLDRLGACASSDCAIAEEGR